MNITVYKVIKGIRITAQILSCSLVIPLIFQVGWYTHIWYLKKRKRVYIVGKSKSKRISVSR